MVSCFSGSVFEQQQDGSYIKIPVQLKIQATMQCNDEAYMAVYELSKRTTERALREKSIALEDGYWISKCPGELRIALL